MKVNRKIVFAVAYIVVALVAYILFIKYSYAKYDEYTAIKRSEWIARGRSAEFFDNYAREGFLSTVYGRNVVNVGLALVFGGLVGAFVLMTISDALTEKRKKNT